MVAFLVSKGDYITGQVIADRRRTPVPRPSGAPTGTAENETTMADTTHDRPQRRRLSRQRGTDADRQVRWRDGRGPGGRARRSAPSGLRCERSGPAGRHSRSTRSSWARCIQAGAGQAPGSPGGPRSAACRSRRARPPSTRSAARPQGDHARRGRDPCRRRRRGRRGWHGEHERRAVSAARRPLRLSPGRRGRSSTPPCHDALWCAIEECHVGTHAERVAIANKVSREDQDEFALRSHHATRSRRSTPVASTPSSPR